MTLRWRLPTIAYPLVWVAMVVCSVSIGRAMNHYGQRIRAHWQQHRPEALAALEDPERFFAEAPRMNPNASLIKGAVCGVKVEEVSDPLMQKIRYLDKLVDELAKGKKMSSVLRASTSG